MVPTDAPVSYILIVFYVLSVYTGLASRNYDLAHLFTGTFTMTKSTRGEKPQTSIHLVKSNAHQHENVPHVGVVDTVAWALDHGYRPFMRARGPLDTMIWATRMGYPKDVRPSPLLLNLATAYIAVCRSYED